MPTHDSSIPPVWLRATGTPTPIPRLSQLPAYGAIFFFRSIGKFKRPFLLLTGASVTAAILGFGATYLVSRLINEAAHTTVEHLLWYYVPAFIGLAIAKEYFSFFIRKYGEAFGVIYADHINLSFLQSILKLRFSAVANVAPQKIIALISTYISNVRLFVDDWFWGSSQRLTQLAITVTILWYQSPLVFGINLIFFISFSALALKISGKFSPIVAKFAAEELKASTVIGGFSYNLPTVRRLGLGSFMSETYGRAIRAKWERFCTVRTFHAKRWFLQILLLNTAYIATLSAGVYQVIQGTLSIGYLVLIKYAFDSLNQTLIFIIEYYVSLVQQREDSRIVRTEFALLEGRQAPEHALELGSWNSISLKNVHCILKPSGAEGTPIHIRVPDLQIARGAKIGVIGPSGVGKSSLLAMLLNLLEFEGEYFLDGQSIVGSEIASRDFGLINNSDPLFALSLRDNLQLGKDIPEATLRSALDIVCANDFAKDLDARVGEHDFNLSSGQQQRLRLARGLIADSQVYLLDEPFNGIDDATKTKILERMKVFFTHKTVVLVTHNESELKLVDAVFEFEAGVLRRSVRHG